MDRPPIFGSPLVTAAARKLVATVNAFTREEAEENFEAFLDGAEESDAHFDAAFLAAQMLRDLDQIDPEEAVYVFAQLLQLRNGTLEEPGLEAVEYLQAHGEGSVATLIVDAPDTYDVVLTDGEQTLLTMRATETKDTASDDAPASIAVVSELVLTLSASSPGSEREAAWAPLMEAMKEVSIHARVSAVRRLRDIGALTAAEHAALIDKIITERLVPAVTCDREEQRRDRSSGLGKDDIPSPFRRREREKPLHHRTWRIIVACLRQVGEHDLANLDLTDSGAYRKLVEEGDASMPNAAHPHRLEIHRQWKAAGGPTDEDLNLVVDYWGHLLRDAEAEAFEERIRDDEGFFMRIAPLMNRYVDDKQLPRPLQRRLALRRAAKRIEHSEVRHPATRTRPDEAEIDLVQRYVDDKLDEHECVFFEARLLVDEAFFHRVAPYVRVWLRDGEDPTARRLRLVRPDLYAAIKAFPIREFAILDDAEAAVLADYWGGSMTEEEMTALENRMSDDQAFFARIAPKLMIFFMRLPPEFIEAGAEFKLGKVH